MKSLSIIQKTAFCQNRKNIRDALTCVSPIFIPIKPKIGTLSIFLIQNRGKGPPGGSHSRDWSDSLIPEIKPATGKSSNNYYQDIKYQYSITYNN